MNELKREFFTSQIKFIRDIKETEKIKISLVFYERTQSTCILRVCKNRNLSEVCKSHMEIKHPNIVVVYDYLYTDDDTYIIEEYISGRSLEEIIKEDGIFSEDDTVQIITKVCDGLEQLHSLEPPLVHNDIKTSNIMITDDGSVKLFDFDISRLYRRGASKNTELFGTEEYAAPEHFGYGQSEPRTDIYSIGVTMHRMLTGKSLDNEHKSTYNGSLKNIINKCIQISPEKRYATVSLLKKDLKKYKNKTVMLIKNTVLAIFMVIGLICGVVVCCNMFVDGAERSLENTSDSYVGDISNEYEKDTEEIEITTNQIEEIEDITEDIAEDTIKDTTEDITQESTTTIKEEASAHVHRYIQKVIEATCAEKGYIEYKCSCGEQYINETPAKGHAYIEQLVEATCTEKGYTKYTCACGESYIGDSIEMLGHIWINATCETAKKCQRCNIEEGEALGHKYERYVCSACGKRDKEGYDKATDPALNLKKGEYYSQVLINEKNGTLRIRQYLFENDSNEVKYTSGYYEKEPLKDAKGEYLHPYVYNGITYYKHSETSCSDYKYEIVGGKVSINDEIGGWISDYLLNIDGGLVDWFDIQWFSGYEGKYILYHDETECGVNDNLIYKRGFKFE